MPDWSMQTWLGLLLAVVGGLALIGLATWMLVRRREHEWRVLARRLKLSYFHDGGGPRVQGALAGRAVEIRVASESSDAGGAVVEAVIAVAVPGSPIAMSAHAVPGMIGEMAHLAEARVLVGDAAFDQSVHIVGISESEARDYWTPARRQTFLELIRQQGDDRLELSEGRLIIGARGFISDHAPIEDNVQRLLRASQALEADSPISSEGSSQ